MIASIAGDHVPLSSTAYIRMDSEPVPVASMKGALSSSLWSRNLHSPSLKGLHEKPAAEDGPMHTRLHPSPSTTGKSVNRGGNNCFTALKARLLADGHIPIVSSQVSG